MEQLYFGITLGRWTVIQTIGTIIGIIIAIYIGLKQIKLSKDQSILSKIQIYHYYKDSNRDIIEINKSIFIDKESSVEEKMKSGRKIKESLKLIDIIDKQIKMLVLSLEKNKS